MTDTTAKIRAKACEATGLTEEIASRLFNQVGSHVMAIVELEVKEPHGPNTEGKRRIDLVLTQVEPSTDPNLDAHLRELTRTLYYNRQVAIGAEPTLETEGPEPTVDAVIKANPGLKSHDYLSSMLAMDNQGENGPVCDVCGKTETDRIHHMPATDPFNVEDDEDDEDDSDPEPDSAA